MVGGEAAGPDAESSTVIESHRQGRSNLTPKSDRSRLLDSSETDGQNGDAQFHPVSGGRTPSVEEISAPQSRKWALTEENQSRLAAGVSRKEENAPEKPGRKSAQTRSGQKQLQELVKVGRNLVAVPQSLKGPLYRSASTTHLGAREELTCSVEVLTVQENSREERKNSKRTKKKGSIVPATTTPPPDRLVSDGEPTLSDTEVKKRFGHGSNS